MTACRRSTTPPTQCCFRHIGRGSGGPLPKHSPAVRPLLYPPASRYLRRSVMLLSPLPRPTPPLSPPPFAPFGRAQGCDRPCASEASSEPIGIPGLGPATATCG